MGRTPFIFSVLCFEFWRIAAVVLPTWYTLLAKRIEPPKRVQDLDAWDTEDDVKLPEPVRHVRRGLDDLEAGVKKLRRP